MLKNLLAPKLPVAALACISILMSAASARSDCDRPPHSAIGPYKDYQAFLDENREIFREADLQKRQEEMRDRFSVAILDENGNYTNAEPLLDDQLLADLARAAGVKSKTPVKVRVKPYNAKENSFDIWFDGSEGSQRVTIKAEDIPDHGMTFRVLAGQYARKSITDNLFTGQFGLKDGGTRIAGVEIGKVLLEGSGTFPVDFVVNFALLKHFQRGRQDDLYQGRLTLNAQYTLPLGPYVPRTRLSVGLGPTYTTGYDVDETEHVLLHDKNERSSRLMNALVVRVDTNLGDLTGSQSLNKCVIGLSVEHRSGFFGIVPAFHHVFGGGDWNAVYSECKF